MVLEKINQVNDIKNLSWEELEILSDEIREFLIEKISITGGHLASNLGVVELTMAMHLSFNLPEDKFVWDVGHQAYTHKLLTGRKTGFDELRKYGGMSGFPKRKESDCDSFDTGHSSTSISAGMGLVQARDLLNQNHYVVSVIGDGALTGGMAYEALNNASRLKKNFIIVLNDNKMSISENVGGMSNYLNSLRTAEFYTGFKTGVESTLNKLPHGDRVAGGLKKTKDGIKQLFLPGMLFENMGIKYLGPVDGHNLSALRKVFSDAKRVKGAVLIHVLTKKGKGYEPAEKHPAKFHGTDPFFIETGLPKKKKEKANYTDVFSSAICQLAKKNDNFVAITAAMPDGTGLKRFALKYPSRFIDVGIAEEHAVTFAAGLAAGGVKPIVAVYSSFLQRAYDQILHDVCIQNLPVVFAIDRAGLVGSDGETHQGIFDLSFLATIPGLCIAAPKNKWELADMLKYSLSCDGPIAIRYPRGEAYEGLSEHREKIIYGKSEMLFEESEIALFAVGSMVKIAAAVRERLKDAGKNCTLVNARFVKPFDEEMLKNLAGTHKLLVTMEENVVTGGFGERVSEFVSDHELGMKVLKIALPDEYVEHGNVNLLYRETGIDEDSIVKRILAIN
ncbi:MAG: 1-deoxy-D-xylulose-5-phosphate synthase [Lachnospiraceae bacterium]